MRKQRIDLWGCVFLLWVTVAVAGGAQEKPSAAPVGSRHSLWKVMGASNTVYLLGSIHVLKKTDYPLPPVIENAFTNSPIVVFETDIAALEDPSIALKLMSKARLPEGETLQEHLSPAVYKAFTNHLSGSVLPLEMVEQFTPAMAAMTLEMLEMQKMGLDPQYGVDKHFFALAGKKKEIVPLETVDFQIGLLTDFSKEEGELLMKSTLKEIDTTKNDLMEMLKAWQTGDAAKLEKLLNEAVSEAPVLYRRLLTDRNHNWLPKIEELARGGKNAIVIVGAGHLVGKEGLVELLREKGFKITQQ
jgi:uncharacterized protein YbaP (TraB family)